MNYGLNQRDINTITEIIRRYPDVSEVKIFGSRALGNHHKGSDIDLAIMNARVSDKTIRKMLGDFEESLLPYFVDVVNYPALENKSLREHISRIGKELFISGTTIPVNDPKAHYRKGSLYEL
jgi:uncharacterized protein